MNREDFRSMSANVGLQAVADHLDTLLDAHRRNFSEDTVSSLENVQCILASLLNELAASEEEGDDSGN